MTIFPWDDNENKPVGVNEKYELWIDQGSTNYAQRENVAGVSLGGWTVCLLRDIKTGDPLTRILYDNKNEPRSEDEYIEGIGIKIDMIKFLNQEIKGVIDD